VKPFQINDSIYTLHQDLLKRILTADPVERATVSQIFNHSWLRHRTDLSKDAEAELYELQLKMPVARSYTELADLQSAEHITETSSRGARDRHSHRRHPTDEESSYIGRLKDRGESSLTSELEVDSLTKFSSMSLSVSGSLASNPTSPIRGSHPALDCLTDELDRSIFDRRPSHSASSTATASNDGPPTTAQIQAVVYKFKKSGLDRSVRSDCDDTGCDMKGWGAPRPRISGGVSAKSPTQVRTSTRNSSSDVTMHIIDATDDIERTTSRRITSESSKVSGKQSSFPFKFLNPTAISTSGTSTTSSSRNGSTRVAPQLSPNAFSDELDKRLSGLQKRMP
jgi:serine/threonine protein kinase